MRENGNVLNTLKMVGITMTMKNLVRTMLSNFLILPNFHSKKDSLILSNQCAKYVFQYKYPTKLKKDNEEDSYIIFLKPQQDSISIIKGIDDDLQCDNIFNTLCLNDSTIIFRDRRVFLLF